MLAKEFFNDIYIFYFIVLHFSRGIQRILVAGGFTSEGDWGSIWSVVSEKSQGAESESDEDGENILLSASHVRSGLDFSAQ